MEITQAQKYEILEHELLNGAGLEEILKKCLEILMKSERKIHNENYLDYSNGYRYRKIYGSGKLLELQVPRTRNGNFYPMILALLKDQQEEAQRVAYSLYRKGLTTQDVGEVFEELYGKKYSTSQVSRMFDYARKEAEEWLARPLENYYPILYIDALYASTRRGDSCSKEAYFSVLAVKSDKTREVLGIYNNPHESASFWDEILQNLRDRGVHKVGLVVRGALPNVEAGLILLYGLATEMSCYNYPITAFVHEQQHFRWD